MNAASTARRRNRTIGALALAALLTRGIGVSQSTTPLTPSLLTVSQTVVAYGPYNGRFLQGGLGLTKNLHSNEPLAAAQRAWSMSLWFKSDEQAQTAFVAGVGRPWESSPRYLALKDGRPAFWAGGAGEGHELLGASALTPGAWHSLAVSVDSEGKTHLFEALWRAAGAGKPAVGRAWSRFGLFHGDSAGGARESAV